MGDDNDTATGDAQLTFIGHIATPWKVADDCPRNAMESDALCQVILHPPFDQALGSLDSCTHLFLLYWLDQADRGKLVHAPPMDNKTHGTFALRTPNRPNPIGLAVADLISIAGPVLSVRHVDCIDGTPLIDIKPYFASVDSRPDAQVGWHEARANPLPPRG